MGAALGFGPIKDDDELLDRLGSRCADDEDGMEALLVSWTTSIDADEKESARGVGPLGLRPVPGLGGGSGGSGGGDDSSVRVVKVRRARAVAVLGALVLTVSGGGVAAAINQGDLAPLRTALQKAGVPVAVAMPTTSSSPEVVAEADPASVEALEEIVDRARNAARSGEIEKAKGMLEAVRSVGAQGGAADEVTASAERLEAWIDQSPSVLADTGPTKDPLALAIATSAVSSTSTSTSSPTASGTAGAGTTTKKPESATPTGTGTGTGTGAGTGAGTGVATTAPAPAEAPVSGGSDGTSAQPGTTTPSAAPTPTNVGSASGEQTAGTSAGTPAPQQTAPADDTPPAAGGASDPAGSAGSATGTAKPAAVAPTITPTSEPTTPQAAAADSDD